MASVNKAVILGNLGRDPELRTMQDGTKVATLSVATSEKWRDKQSGEQREKTEWHRVVVFNDHIVQVIERFCHKGQKIYVEGKLQTRKWTDQGGAERYTTEIVLGKYRGELVMLSSISTQPADPYQPAAADGSALAAPRGDLDDEIPF